jgi:hypothetical protein
MNMDNGHDNIEQRLKIAERLIEALFESHEKTQGELRMLAKSQVLMSETMTKLSDTMIKLEERMLETTEKLDALIHLSDQHLRDHREGRA